MALGVDLRIEVVELGPVGIRGIEVLEIVDEVGAVELAVAEIPGERREPGAAEQASGVAQRILAADAGPIRERRAGEQDRADEIRGERGEHHQRPAALAIADHERFVVRVRMQLAQLAHERDLGRAHRFDGLARQRLREEHDEVARMPRLERDADLAVDLEAADARAVTGARIDHHEGALVRVGWRVVLGRLDADQRVVRGLRQAARVDYDLVIEDEHRRAAGLFVLEVLITALAQHIEGQNGALPRVDHIGGRACIFRFHGDSCCLT